MSWRVALESIEGGLEEAALRSQGCRNLVVVKAALLSALPFKSLGQTVLSFLPSIACRGLWEYNWLMVMTLAL